MTRRNVAIGVLIVWAVALGILAEKEFGKGDSERVAEAATRLYPVAYYYVVYQRGAPIGAVLSQLDTATQTTNEFRLIDHFRGRLARGGPPQFVDASLSAYLSRRFVVDSFTLAMAQGEEGLHLRRTFPKAPKTIPPELVPMMLMLSGSPAIGRSRSYAMYDPLGDSTAHVTFRIAAESLFTVSDSAMYDSTTKRWISAHADTVRSWSIAPMNSGFTLWVDAQGRVVSASGPHDIRLIRTAYEIAFENENLREP